MLYFLRQGNHDFILMECGTWPLFVMLLVSAMSAEPSGRHVRRGISRPQRFQTSVTDTVPCYSEWTEWTERTRRDRGRPVTGAPGQPILQAGYYSQQFFFSLSRGVLDRGLVEWPWPVFQPRAGWHGGGVGHSCLLGPLVMLGRSCQSWLRRGTHDDSWLSSMCRRDRGCRLLPIPPARLFGVCASNLLKWNRESEMMISRVRVSI
jgi:hypothetical protein